MKQKGFTLIELLVVIAIFGFLTAVILIALNTSRVKSRNVRRLADVNQLSTAFKLGFDANSSLPSSAGNWVCVASSCYEGWSSWAANGTVDAFIAPYVSKPSDPKGGSRGAGGFLYYSAWSGGAGFGGTFQRGRI